eukprot:scaffold109711_cov78-Phaeocystis_antarctica.AAC.2
MLYRLPERSVLRCGSRRQAGTDRVSNWAARAGGHQLRRRQRAVADGHMLGARVAHRATGVLI